MVRDVIDHHSSPDARLIPGIDQLAADHRARHRGRSQVGSRATRNSQQPGIVCLQVLS
jgi:hypothetical protein